MVEGARLESVYTGKPVSRVRISHSPPFLYPFSGRAAVSWSCAMGPREPRQVRKEAALSESFHVREGAWRLRFDVEKDEAAGKAAFLLYVFWEGETRWRISRFIVNGGHRPSRIWSGRNTSAAHWPMPSRAVTSAMLICFPARAARARRVRPRSWQKLNMRAWADAGALRAVRAVP